MINNLCFKSGWDEREVYEFHILKIYDIIYRDFEYFPESEEDIERDMEAKKNSIMNGLRQLRKE